MRRLSWAAAILIAVAFLVVFVVAASATWRPEYAQADPQVQSWYRAAQLTDAAAARLGFKGCCDSSDVVKTKFRVDQTSHGDEWWFVDRATGEWRQVPPDIIHWGESAPGGEPTLFALAHDFMGSAAGTLTCFYPGRDGN